MGKILWDREIMAELKKSFPRTTEMTIRNALNRVHCSELSKRICKRALDLGAFEKGKEEVTVLEQKK